MVMTVFLSLLLPRSGRLIDCKMILTSSLSSQHHYSKTNFAAQSEIVLYLAVLKWLHFDFDQRKQHALDLMALIRFAHMDENELFACYNPPILPELIESPAIKALMADAFNMRMKRKASTETDAAAVRQAPRNYRLSGAYKPLELWCSLTSAKAAATKTSSKDSVKDQPKNYAKETAKISAKDSPKDSAKAVKGGRIPTIFLPKDEEPPESSDYTAQPSPASKATSSLLSDFPTSFGSSSVASSPAASPLAQGMGLFA